jgi:hypothetical protein
MTQQYTQLFCLQVVSKFLQHLSGGGEGNPWGWGLEREEDERDTEEEDDDEEITEKKKKKPKRKNWRGNRKKRRVHVVSEDETSAGPEDLQESRTGAMVSILKLNEMHHSTAQHQIGKIPFPQRSDLLKRKEEIRNRIKRYQQTGGGGEQEGEERKREDGEEEGEEDEESLAKQRKRRTEARGGSGGYYLGKGESIQIDF